MGTRFLMEYSEPFLALIFLFAVLVVIADLCIVRNRRERVAANIKWPIFGFVLGDCSRFIIASPQIEQAIKCCDAVDQVISGRC